ncbi:MAG: type II toxin-antitoxin system HicB family antitoxin [Candidatus Korobacteraceae bacterium]
MEYIAYLHKDGKSDFGVSFPDFPGCITAGRTLEEARRLAPEALTLHIQGMIEDGEAIPEPSTLDELASDPARRGAVCFLVSANPVEDKAVRVNITARASQIRKIDDLADRAGLTRSAFLVRQALESADRQGKSQKRPTASRRAG